MARKKQDPFPCRDHLDLLAFSIECIFLVFRDNDKILASGHRGGFQQAFDFPFSRTRIHHIPSNLYELYHVILPLKHKIALTISLIVGNLVRREPHPVQLHKHGVFQIFPIVVALRHKHGTTHTVIYTVVFIKRFLFLYQRTVVFGDSCEHEDVTDIISPKIQVILTDFKPLGLDVLVDGIDGGRLGEIGHDTLDEIPYHTRIGYLVMFGQVLQYHRVEIAVKQFQLLRPG